MKNKNLKVIWILTIMLIGYSCNKDFLEKKPTRFISVDDVASSGKKNPDVIKGTLRGIYSMMIQTGTGGTASQDDFGQKGYDIYSDMLSGDMALSVSTYGYYRALTSYQATTDYTRNENYRPWRYYYRVIRSANLVIKSLGGNDSTPTDVDNKYAMGQAKALRAYGYFYLSQLYITEYTPSSKVLPLYIDPDVPNQAQSTTEEIYKQMIKDLTEATTLLDGFQRTAKNEVNKYVAEGLLAYVYAATGTSANNLKAKNLAEDIIANSGTPLTTKAEATGGFNSVTTPSWLWGIDITKANNLNLVSWWGQMDLYTYSYQWAGDKKAIDKSLFDAIKTGDIRKTQFFSSNPSSSNYLIPLNKFYDPNKKIGGQRSVTTDYIYMRVDEFYLLSAEMSAKEGDDASAKNRLKQLLAQRFDNATDYAYIDGLSGKALQDEIYLQTRIELWGEGKSYLAMKRNKAKIKRGSNHLSNVGKETNYNDDKLTFKIPQSEIQNNPFIKNQ